MKLDLPEVSTSPLRPSSCSRRSSSVAKRPSSSGVSTFMARPGWSKVTRPTPLASTSKVTESCCVMGSPRSNAFDDGGDAPAGTDAPGGQGRGLAGPLQLVQRRAQDDGARGAQRVAHGNRAAVDVHAIERDAQVARRFHGHSGKGLVYL